MGGILMKEYQGGDVVLHPGDHPKALFKVLSGGITIYMNYGQPTQNLVGSYAAPFCFGETSVLADHPCPYTIMANGQTVLMQVPEEDFAEFIQDHNAEAMAIMTAMAQKLRRSYEILGEFKALQSSQGMNLLSVKSLAEQCAETELDTQDLAIPYGYFSMVTARALPPADPDPVQEIPDNGGSEPLGAATLTAPVPEVKSGIFPSGHRPCSGIQHPEFAEYLYFKEYTCPHCMSKFDDARISYNKLTPTPAPKDHSPYDLRIFYEEFKAEWYEVITCPYCYFSTYYEYFRETDFLRKPYYEEALDAARKEISLDFYAERDLDFVFTQHYLALLCSRGLKNYRQINARMWENLIWLYREAGNPEMAQFARKKALVSYQEVYQNCGLDAAQEQRTCMAVAMMLYQIGEYKQAREWAMRVRMNRAGKRAYANLAAKLIDDIRYEIEQMEPQQ